MLLAARTRDCLVGSPSPGGKPVRSAFFVLLSAVLCSPSGAAAKGPVFERLVLASHKKVKQNHYSCLARLADDRVLAVWTSWEGHGVRRIIGSFSADHG
jgi:hypothetical protein